MEFKGKRVTVVGLARSGISAARALHALGARVTVTDKKPLDQLAKQVRELGSGIVVEAGGHPDRIFIETDLVVLSPGVPKIAPVLQARRHGIRVISELELAWLLSDSPYVGITGTNGKSTVTTLVGLMLAKARKKVLVAGTSAMRSPRTYRCSKNRTGSSPSSRASSLRTLNRSDRRSRRY